MWRDIAQKWLANQGLGLCRGVVTCASEIRTACNYLGEWPGGGKETNRSVRIIIDGNQAHSALV